MNFEKIAHNIKKAENGIYYSESESNVSYAEDDNDKRQFNLWVFNSIKT